MTLKQKVEKYWAEQFQGILCEFRRAENVQMVTPSTDPPDAVYRVVSPVGGETKEWAEFTGVYASNDVAKETWDDARGMRQSTVNRRESVQLGPDAKVAAAARGAIIRKIQKANYAVLAQGCGRGHLVLVVPHQAYPPMDKVTIAAIEDIIPNDELFIQQSFGWLWVIYQVPDYDDGLNIVRVAR